MNTVFLDRDGTIIQDPLNERVDSIDKIELFEDSIAALKYFRDNDFQVVIITNQAGIAEGRITEVEFWNIHNQVLSQLSVSEVDFVKTYMNGEAGPEASDWRKPGPKMLLQAAEDLTLDLSKIYMVGDNQSDVQAGINAGCKGSILVKTARNKIVESPNATYTAQTLLDAAHFIVANS